MISLFFNRKIGFRPPSRNIYENRSSALFPLIFSFRDRKSGFWMTVLIDFLWYSMFFNWLALIFNYFQMIFNWFVVDVQLFFWWFSLTFNWSSMISDDFQLLYHFSLEKLDSNRLPETYMKIAPATYSRSFFRSGTANRAFGWLF